MALQEIDAAYGRRRIIPSAQGFRSIDTLFEIPESHLYATLVDALEAGVVSGKDYSQLFQDVRWAIDTVHRNGDIKAEILSRREDFILQDPELASALDRWKRAGKKLFVLSNSEWTFTNGVLSYLLDGQDPARPAWQDYFDLVVTSAHKPVFFEEPQPALPTERHSGAFTGGERRLAGAAARSLRRGGPLRRGPHLRRHPPVQEECFLAHTAPDPRAGRLPAAPSRSMPRTWKPTCMPRRSAGRTSSGHPSCRTG